MGLGDRGLEQPTRASLYTLQAGEHLILPQVNEPATPTFAFGDGDTGLYERFDDSLVIAVAGVNKIFFEATVVQSNVDWVSGSQTNGPSIKFNSAATSTVPTLTPSQTDQDTGVGWRTANIGVLVGGAQNCMEFAAIAAAPACAFNGTAAIIKQTGVAVTSAGIHAALVNLGLIAA